MKKENLSRYDSEVWSDNSKNCEQCKDCIFTTIEEYQNVLARYTLICMMTQNPMTLYSKEFRASIISVASIPRARGDEPATSVEFQAAYGHSTRMRG